MRRDFYYGWTCPEIDSNISSFRQTVSDHLDDLISELSPLFYNTPAKIEYRKDWENIIFNSSEDIFENVRKCNSDMRDEADRVVKDLMEERDEFERLSKYWENEADEKDRIIEDLKEQIENGKDLQA
jgi:hypothetical protein